MCPSQLRVSKDSQEASIAGAIANRLRESARVAVVGIGPDAVALGARAVALARQYVEQVCDLRVVWMKGCFGI